MQKAYSKPQTKLVDLGGQGDPKSLLVQFLYHHLVEQYDGTPYPVELPAKWVEILLRSNFT